MDEYPFFAVHEFKGYCGQPLGSYLLRRLGPEYNMPILYSDIVEDVILSHHPEHNQCIYEAVVEAE